MLNKNTKDVILSVHALCPCVQLFDLYKTEVTNLLHLCLSKENSENLHPGASYISVFCKPQMDYVCNLH